MQDKEYCQNCGVELTKENKYMDGMCNECKMGIDCDYVENDEKLLISNNNSIVNINPYLLFGVLTINHRTCEDIFSDIGSIIDKLSIQIQFEPSNINNYIEDTSCLKDIYNKLSSLEISIKSYKENVNRFIEDAQDSSER